MENRGTSREPKSVQGAARTVLDLILPYTTSPPRPNSSVVEADFVHNKGSTAKTSLGWQGMRGSRAPRAGCSGGTSRDRKEDAIRIFSLPLWFCQQLGFSLPSSLLPGLPATPGLRRSQFMGRRTTSPPATSHSPASHPPTQSPTFRNL